MDPKIESLLKAAKKVVEMHIYSAWVSTTLLTFSFITYKNIRHCQKSFTILKLIFYFIFLILWLY